MTAPITTSERIIVRTKTVEHPLYNRGLSDGTDTNGMFIFPADDTKFLDEFGQIDAQKVFYTNPKTGDLFTTQEEIEKHMTKGYVSHWNELTNPDREKPTNIILATGSPDKLIESRSSLQHYDPQVKLVTQFLGFTPEDSKEEQANGGEIVIDKINRSIIEELNDLSESQIQTIKTNLGVENFDTTIAISNDISLMFDPQLKDSPVWDFLRDTHDPLIKEIFEDNHDFPGKRTREITKACGGAANFYRLIKDAIKEREAAGYTINKNVSSGTWLHIRPLEKGKTQLPDAGLMIYQQLNRISLVHITEQKLSELIENNSPFAMDEAEIPNSRINQKTPDGAPITMANARVHAPDYFSEGDYPLGNILHTLLGENFINAARLDEPQNWDPIKRPKKTKLLIVGGSKSHANKIEKQFTNLKGDQAIKVKHIRDLDRINSCASLEKLANKSDAIILPNHNYNALSQEEALAWKSVREFVYAYRLALEGKGSNATSGCPVFATPDAIEEIKYHGTFFNLGSSATKVDNVLKTYNGEAPSLARVIKQAHWDSQDYKKKKDRVHYDYDMMTADELAGTIGVHTLDELGPMVAVLGGATTEELGALEQTEEMAYQAAKAGITLTHGGGTAGVMGAIIKGGIRAYTEGYRGFKQIGIRTPIVSAAEGSIKKFLRNLVNELNEDHGTNLTIDDLVSDGDLNSDYYSLFEDHFHILERNAFGVRQDAVLRFVDEAIVMPGGHGTAYEDVHMNLDAALIALRGKGVFQPSNKPISKHIVNIPDAIDNNKGFWDSYINAKTKDEKKILNQTEHKHALDALKQIIKNIVKNGITPRKIWNINDTVALEYAHQPH